MNFTSYQTESKFFYKTLWIYKIENGNCIGRIKENGLKKFEEQEIYFNLTTR